MLGKPQTNSVGDGITINLMIGNSIDLNLECKSIFLVIFQWQIERCLNNIDKTNVFDALREKIPGDKHLKQWLRTDLILKAVSDECFCFDFWTW